jgi:hypothetical protein
MIATPTLSDQDYWEISQEWVQLAVSTVNDDEGTQVTTLIRIATYQAVLAGSYEKVEIEIW